ncbi:hypothetical protein EDD37DRAFT_644254 [Exophiala viscosa]|uniref:Uncharacterized protein n=1 Tax=Exophiala viscosa TaxID=2486360 RepID=A0AAN6DJT3_9EURO|nr:hypothetical protein EDD36DRAFT_423822 [Exophiala viscosa]KAI1628457.1 hypothetical protein EDD37DRAFT_644254 [Exophiala viscosa]
MKKRASDDKSTPVFLFVNKTQKSKSLSKSDGVIAKQINRHAQNFRTRKIEAQRIDSALTSSSSARRIALDGWNRRESGESASSDETSEESSPQDKSTAAPATPSANTPSDDGVVSSNLRPDQPLAQSRHGHSSSFVALISDRDGGAQESWPTRSVEGQAIELNSPVYRANFSSYDCVDPFGSTPIKITNKIHTVLQYTLRIYAYSGNNYKLAFLPPHVRATISQFPIGAVVQRSVFKEHHLYALMAAMTARLKHVFDVSPTGEDPQVIRAAASHYLRLELMRCARSGTVDKQTILDILYLAVNEMQYGLYEDVRKHLQIVGKLYHLLDLNEHLDRWISETAAHVDNQLALSTNKRPILASTFDPGPMLPERMAILRREAQLLRQSEYYPNPTRLIVPSGPKGSMGLNDAMSDISRTLDVRMGSAFMVGLKAGAFTGELSHVVADLVDCIEIAKVVWLSPLAVCFDAEWLCRKARAVLRALLALAPENNVGPVDLASKCMECARLCLMVLMTYACTLIGPQTAKLNVKRQLLAKKAALGHWCPYIGWTEECVPVDPKRRLTYLEELQAGFVFWSMLTSIWSCQGASAEEEWFMVRAVNMCRYFGYTTYEDLHDHMSQYLYSKTLAEQALRRVADKVQTVPKNRFYAAA